MVIDFENLKINRVKTLGARFCPLVSKAIVGVGVERDPVVLDCVGNAADYWMENYRGDDPEFEVGDGCDTPGLWYVEGRIKTTYDYEEEWFNSVARRLTPEELQAYEQGHTPFENETRAGMLWHTLEEAAYLECNLFTSWPHIMISFPVQTPETFEGRTAACIDIRKPDLEAIRAVMDSFATWIRMQEEALETKRILRDEIKKEDPNWEPAENLDRPTEITRAPAPFSYLT